MSAVATSAALVTAPWVLLIVLISLLVLVPALVRMVLSKTVPAPGSREVFIRVRLALWLHIEIDVKCPPQ